MLPMRLTPTLHKLDHNALTKCRLVNELEPDGRRTGPRDSPSEESMAALVTPDNENSASLMAPFRYTVPTPCPFTLTESARPTATTVPALHVHTPESMLLTAAELSAVIAVIALISCMCSATDGTWLCRTEAGLQVNVFWWVLQTCETLKICNPRDQGYIPLPSGQFGKQRDRQTQ